MGPEERFVPRFAAEPPQEVLPYGRWAQRLGEELLGAFLALDAEGVDLGEPGEIAWYPDRSWHGRTYVPGSTMTSRGYELYGYVRFVPALEGGEPSDFYAQVDYTEETAARNADWTLDLCEETIGSWRGESGKVAAMTLVWGRPLLAGGRIATAELAGVTVDQCELIEERFTLIAPDDYRGDLLEVKLFGSGAKELARESLYAGEEDEAGAQDAGSGGHEDEDKPSDRSDEARGATA